ncbi:MAG: hypothetical protein R3B72_39310 [Polyangiaceae bacterium]
MVGRDPRFAFTVTTLLLLTAACNQPSDSSTKGEPSAKASGEVDEAKKGPADLPCGRRAACLEEGRCQKAGDACVAKSDEDCRKGLECRAFNRCKAAGGRCVYDLSKAPAGQASCSKYMLRELSGEPVSPCSLSGECKEEGGTCVAAGDVDCKKAEVCAFSGRCVAAGAECVAKEAEACRASGRCCWEGACSLEGDRCVAKTDADCQSSAICLAEGRCKARGGVCVVGSTADCRGSELCKTYGLCVEKEGRCVGSDAAGCKASRLCQTEGLCSAGEEHCVARGEDCARSEICKAYGRCQAAHDRCFIPAKNDSCRGFGGSKGKTPCFDFGECTAEGGVCVASDETRCAVSTLCRWRKCTVEDHRCKIAIEDAQEKYIGTVSYRTDPGSCWWACVNDFGDTSHHCGVRLLYGGSCYGPERKYCEIFKKKPPVPEWEAYWTPITPH